jgi:hypothetical protein
MARGEFSIRQSSSVSYPEKLVAAHSEGFFRRTGGGIRARAEVISP